MTSLETGGVPPSQGTTTGTTDGIRRTANPLVQDPLDANNYTADQLLAMKTEENDKFKTLSFKNVQAALLKKVFPHKHGKGNLFPKKDMRESSATVERWRDMTRQQQDAHIARAQSNTQRASRVRNRENGSDENAARTTRPRTVSPDPDVEEEESEEPPEPMANQMLSLADNQDLREEFVKELEAKKTADPPAHLVGKPPASIGQQNDSLVMRLKKAAIAAWLKLTESMTPAEPLCHAPHPKQRAVLVILNEVADPKIGGGSVSVRELRRPKPQMIVCADSKSDVTYVVNKLISGFSKSSIDFDKYEHVRMFNRDDVERVNDTIFDRKRETFQIPTMGVAVDTFVAAPTRQD